MAPETGSFKTNRTSNLLSFTVNSLEFRNYSAVIWIMENRKKGHFTCLKFAIIIEDRSVIVSEVLEYSTLFYCLCILYTHCIFADLHLRKAVNI